MKAGWVFSVAVVLALAVVPGAAASEQVRLWILPFQSPGDADLEVLAETAPELLTVFFSRPPGVVVVERDHLNRILAEQGLGRNGLAEPSSRRRIGELLGATTMITGSVTRKESELIFTAHATEVGSGRVQASEQVAGAADHLEETLQKLCRKLMESLLTEAHDVGWETEPDPGRSLHFLRGLSFYFAANYHRALGEFIECDRSREPDALVTLWRANCYLAVENYGHALLELTRLEQDGADAVSQAEVERKLGQCLEHLSPDERGFYEELAAQGKR
jgi:TolB-like protein